MKSTGPSNTSPSPSNTSPSSSAPNRGCVTPEGPQSTATKVLAGHETQVDDFLGCEMVLGASGDTSDSDKDGDAKSDNASRVDSSIDTGDDDGFVLIDASASEGDGDGDGKPDDTWINQARNAVMSAIAMAGEAAFATSDVIAEATQKTAAHLRDNPTAILNIYAIAIQHLAAAALTKLTGTKGELAKLVENAKKHLQNGQRIGVFDDTVTRAVEQHMKSINDFMNTLADQTNTLPSDSAINTRELINATRELINAAQPTKMSDHTKRAKDALKLFLTIPVKLATKPPPGIGKNPDGSDTFCFAAGPLVEAAKQYATMLGNQRSQDNPPNIALGKYGLFIVGEPGTGKTTLVNSIGTWAGVKVIQISCSDVVKSYQDDQNKGGDRRDFARYFAEYVIAKYTAQDDANVILFLDDLCALKSIYSKADSNAKDFLEILKNLTDENCQGPIGKLTIESTNPNLSSQEFSISCRGFNLVITANSTMREIFGKAWDEMPALQTRVTFPSARHSLAERAAIINFCLKQILTDLPRRLPPKTKQAIDELYCQIIKTDGQMIQQYSLLDASTNPPTVKIGIRELCRILNRIHATLMSGKNPQAINIEKIFANPEYQSCLVKANNQSDNIASIRQHLQLWQARDISSFLEQQQKTLQKLAQSIELELRDSSDNPHYTADRCQYLLGIYEGLYNQYMDRPRIEPEPVKQDVYDSLGPLAQNPQFISAISAISEFLQSLDSNCPGSAECFKSTVFVVADPDDHASDYLANFASFGPQFFPETVFSTSPCHIPPATINDLNRYGVFGRRINVHNSSNVSTIELTKVDLGNGETGVEATKYNKEGEPLGCFYYQREHLQSLSQNMHHSATSVGIEGDKIQLTRNPNIWQEYFKSKSPHIGYGQVVIDLNNPDIARAFATSYPNSRSHGIVEFLAAVRKDFTPGNQGNPNDEYDSRRVTIIFVVPEKFQESVAALATANDTPSIVINMIEGVPLEFRRRKAIEHQLKETYQGCEINFPKVIEKICSLDLGIYAAHQAAGKTEQFVGIATKVAAMIQNQVALSKGRFKLPNSQFNYKSIRDIYRKLSELSQKEFAEAINSAQTAIDEFEDRVRQATLPIDQTENRGSGADDKPTEHKATATQSTSSQNNTPTIISTSQMRDHESNKAKLKQLTEASQAFDSAVNDALKSWDAAIIDSNSKKPR